MLNALNCYYKRLSEDPDIKIPKFGFGLQPVSYMLVISRNGELIQIQSLLEEDRRGKKTVPRELILPAESPKSGEQINSDFLWGTSIYILGFGNAKQERIRKAYEACRKFHHELGNGVDDEGIKAVLRFLNTYDPEKTETDYQDKISKGPKLVFRLEDEKRYIHERPALQKIWTEYYNSRSSGTILPCLVTGHESPAARTHPEISGVRGAQSKPVLVSFEPDSFESYGKKKAYNSPVSEKAAFGYTAALKYLMSRESRQKVYMGNTTVVFWAEKKHPAEEIAWDILGDDEEFNETGIERILEDARHGRKPAGIPDPGETEFYILGLAPNGRRVAVKFWHVSTAGEFFESLDRHFQDIRIIKNFENEPEFPKLRRLLAETAVKEQIKNVSAVKEQIKNVSSVLANEMMRSILTGSVYPSVLMHKVTERIFADNRINYHRTSLIKGYLVRNGSAAGKEMLYMLDENRQDVPYRLGRLFAVLEKIQEEAHRDGKEDKSRLNRTIRDSYFRTAATAPSTIFPVLFGMKTGHMTKLFRNNPGRAVNLEKMITEIMSGEKMSVFPKQMFSEDQGIFIIGYYHQRKEIYTKKENTDDTGKSN